MCNRNEFQFTYNRLSLLFSQDLFQSYSTQQALEKTLIRSSGKCNWEYHWWEWSIHKGRGLRIPYLESFVQSHNTKIGCGENFKTSKPADIPRFMEQFFLPTCMLQYIWKLTKISFYMRDLYTCMHRWNATTQSWSERHNLRILYALETMCTRIRELLQQFLQFIMMVTNV